jgi:urease accessory protein
VTYQHQDGLLELNLGVDKRGCTRVFRHRQRFPLRTTTAMYLDAEDPGMAFVYVQNPTGGVIEGDRLSLKVVAEPHAHVHVTTQSSTKIHRMTSGHARQEITFDLGGGAYCEYLPDPLIPQRGSRFEQSILVQLAEGAKFVGAEIVAPGRYASGEEFAYSRLSMKTEIRVPAGELCVDAVVLEPETRSPAHAGILGPNPYLGSLLAIAPDRDAERLVHRLDTALAHEASVLGAAGMLPQEAGVLVRLLAPSSILAKRSLVCAWDAVRQELVGHPAPRQRK